MRRIIDYEWLISYGLKFTIPIVFRTLCFRPTVYGLLKQGDEPTLREIFQKHYTINRK